MNAAKAAAVLPSIFVVNMARSAERREYIRRHLGELNLPYELFAATDCETMQPAEYESRLNANYWRKLRGRAMPPPIIGCYLSHCRLWAKIADENIPRAIILEDDAALHPNFARIVADAIATDYLWDVISLRLKTPASAARILGDTLGGGNWQLIRPRRRCQMLVGYVITKRGAEKLLEYTQNIRAPIDWLYGEWWLNGLQFFAVRPGIVSQGGEESTIGNPPRLSRTFSEWLWARKTLTLSFFRRHLAATFRPLKKK